MTTKSPATTRDTLNARNQAFCRFVVAGNTGSESYRKAGYSPNKANVAASQLLAKPAIQQEIGRLKALQHRDGATTRAYVIARLEHFSEHAKPDSAAIRATELLGKTERMFVDVTEGSGPAGEVSQLRSYTLEELRELRAVMVDGVRSGQVAIEAPADVVEVEARVIDDEDAGAHAREEEDDGGNQGIHDSLV